MDKEFKVKVNNSLDFNLNQKQVNNLDLIQKNKSNYHLLIDNKAFNADLIQSDFYKKTYSIIVNSNTYQIKITNELDALIDKMGFSSGTAKQINEIKSPMPGIIININVKEGDEVKEGDTLLILEAMKMENAITCHRNAIIKKLTIKKGDAIEKGKILIELE
ncbi:MAG: acetyl-CoA carboxylase biotin carboxyl carrier protein subunit [Flavobacteriaceae bacterium]|nr:acetyl-CoA carboxylase biotin carboxyl carrier protein subunit [Flavobacteriaceae bacterium]